MYIHVCVNHMVHLGKLPTCIYMYKLRKLIFSRKSDCIGCAVLLYLVCLFDLFFLPSHLSFKNMSLSKHKSALHVHVHVGLIITSLLLCYYHFYSIITPLLLPIVKEMTTYIIWQFDFPDDKLRQSL